MSNAEDVNMDFIFASNPLPLIYVIFAYNAYMYLHEWKTVLVWTYIWKALHIVFVLLFQNSIFKNLFDETSGLLVGSDQTHGLATAQELLLGTLIYAGFGIILGYIHVYLFATPPAADTFMPLSFWNPSQFTTTTNNSAVTTVNDTTPATDAAAADNTIQSITTDKHTQYKLKTNNPYIITDSSNNTINNNNKKHSNLSQFSIITPTILKGDDGYTMKLPNYLKQNDNHNNNDENTSSMGLWPIETIFGYGDNDYWYFRKEYWKQVIQLILLGTPTTILFTLNISNGFRAGNIIFLFVMLILLGSFYLWNKNPQIHSWRFNAYYRWWWFSVLIITVFHFWKIISPAINVFISSSLVISISAIAIPYYKFR